MEPVYKHAQDPLEFMNWELAFPTLLAVIVVEKKEKRGTTLGGFLGGLIHVSILHGAAL